MSDSSWLAIDVGNSRIKFALFTLEAREDGVAIATCLDDISIPLDEDPPWQTLLERIHRSLELPINSVIVGSNQAGVARVISAFPIPQLAAPLVINNSENFPLDIQVDEPHRVGLDRLLNSIAANSHTANGSPTIIVDCGTATTIDLVSSTGIFEGGAILPGFDLSARALNLYTEALPLFTMEQLVGDSNSPPESLGKNTETAIASGVYWSQVGAVREIVTRMTSEMQDFNLVMTGGGSHLLVPHFKHAKHIPQLALMGLVIVAGNTDLETS
jgi:type III pantothenate kinase